MNKNFFDFNVSKEKSEFHCKEIIRWVNLHDKCRWLACLNPHSYAVSLNDKEFFNALLDADILIPDGVGLLLVSRLFRMGIDLRVTGSDIFYSLNELMDGEGGFKVFFLGSSNDTLLLISKKMSIDYPNIKIVGLHSPPFKNEFNKYETDHMIEIINNAKPDILWVGMTAPKQEKWIYHNRKRLNVGFSCAVGAVFDFYSGQVIRPNKFFQSLGLEWLFRLFKQPKKLWRRVFVSGPKFIAHLVFFSTKNFFK
jgi:N-acetylglucosaminyldiphosphoundecaprenol N-acetyl-beta-D-mannosaminyltransferase